MASLTNQSSSSKSMTGLSDTYSTNIVCDTFQCDAQFTISPGCVISLPNNSIPDAALSTNVALLNRNPQTFTGVNNFNADTNQNAIQYFVSTGGNGTRTRMTQSNNGLEIVNQNNTQFIQIVSRTAAGAAVEGLRVTNGNTAYIQGNLNNRVSIIGNTPPVITIAPPAGSNNFSIANTAWVNTERTTALLPYAKLAGPQTFTGIQNFNGDVKLNYFFVSNYVDLTLTTYENQFYGDIYGYRGVVCQNGFYVKNSPGPGATTYLSINSTGDLLTSGNLNAQSLTLPANSIPDSYLSSNVVLDPDLLNYVALAGSQTITGFKQFTTRPIFQQGIQANQNIVCESIGGGGQQSIIVQDNAELNILNVANGNSINLQTRTTGGVNVVNFKVANGNSAIMTGDTGNTLTVSASTTPTISIQPAGASNTNEIATTQWTKTQLSGYSTLNLNNTFNGTNNFNKGVEFKDVAPNAAVVVRNTVSSNSGGLLISGAGSYNGINNAGDYVVIGFGPSIDTATLNLTTWATGTSGIKITNNAVKQYNPFECAYLQTSPANTTKTNYNIGYQWTITAASFTSWRFYTTANNIYTLAWDGSGDRKLGVWNVEISIGTWSATNDIETLLVWNTISTTNNQANYTSAMCKGTADFFLVSLNIVKLNFVLNVTNLTTTYYLNYMHRLGSSIAIDTDSSFMRFTRIG